MSCRGSKTGPHVPGHRHTFLWTHQELSVQRTWVVEMGPFRGKEGSGTKGLSEQSPLGLHSCSCPLPGNQVASVPSVHRAPQTPCARHPWPGNESFGLPGPHAGLLLSGTWQSLGFFWSSSLEGRPSRAWARLTPSCDDSPATLCWCSRSRMQPRASLPGG